MWRYKLYKKYRREQNVIAADWFKLKDFPVDDKYPFILKEHSNWKNNILLDHVYDYIKNTKTEREKKEIPEKKIEPFPIHKYIHHGLSSQAMLFNLLCDIVVQKDFNFFASLFNYPDVNITEESELTFEHSDRDVFKENQQQPTSFDFAVLNKTGKNIFIEAKYVETEFGKCSTIETGECDGLNPVNDINLCYLTHKGRNYWELMKKHGLHEAFINTPICPFAIYYQFYRELLFALEKNGYYIILIDKRNPAFYKTSENGIDRGLIPILTNLLPEKLKTRVKIIYLQDIVEKLDPNKYKWKKEFIKKYGL